MELNFGLYAGHVRSGFGLDEVEADPVVLVANFSDSDAPATLVTVVDGHRRTDQSWLAFHEFGALDMVRSELVEFKVPE